MPELKNYMEDVVADKVLTVLEDMNCCTCESCQMDVTAIALNLLPTKYVVTHKGELYTKLYALQQQFEVDIIAAVSKAAEIVKHKPRHLENGGTENGQEME